MRPLYAIVGLGLLGAGCICWAALGLSQSSAKEPPPPAPPPAETIPVVKPPTLPPAGVRPIPKQRPSDDLFEVPNVTPRTLPPDAGPVPALDRVEVPEVPGVQPTPRPESPSTGVNPTVFIPSRDPDRVAQASTAPSVGQLSFQEPAVRLEWQGLPTLQAGAASDFTLVARNISSIPLHKVILQVKIPTGVKVASTEPKAELSGTVLMWDLGTLAVKQDQAVRMSFIPTEKGELQCQAWATITGSTAFKAEVREARLAIAGKAPPRVAAGEPVALSLLISNPGDHPAEGVKLTLASLPGLEIKTGTTRIFEIGKIEAGDTREVKVPVVASASGTHKLDILVEASGGVQARSSVNVVAVKANVEVELAGPKLRFVDRKAVYSVKLSNNGDAPATGVIASQAIPNGYKFLSADAGGKMDATGRAIEWKIGELPVGESRELKCELLAVAMGEFTHKITVTGERGLQTEASLPARVEALSAMTMEVVDSDDPVEVGSETSYEIRISNVGSKDEANLKLVCNIPAQFKFKSARGTGKFEVTDDEIIFEPLEKLPARTEVTYRITLVAREKGDAKFKAVLTATGLSEPMTRQETTKIYED